MCASRKASPPPAARSYLCLGADGCDVEFEGNGEEASNVSLARIAPLLDFEVGAVRGAPGSAEEEEAPPVRAEQHKQQGNQLFKLHDHAAAADEYTAGLRLLRTEAKLSTGARCLVKPTDGGTRVRGALLMVLDQAAGRRICSTRRSVGRSWLRWPRRDGVDACMG